MNCHSIRFKWLCEYSRGFEERRKKITKSTNVYLVFLFFFRWKRNLNKLKYNSFEFGWWQMRENFVEWPHELLCSTLQMRFTQSERPKWRAHLLFLSCFEFLPLSALIQYSKIRKKQWQHKLFVPDVRWWWKSPREVLIFSILENKRREKYCKLPPT